MIAVLILYMLFASTFTLGKMALTYCDPIFFVATRMLIAGLLLLGYQALRNKPAWKWQSKHWPLYLQLMIFHIYLAFVLEFWALQYVHAAKACLMYNVSPFVTALYAYLIFSERLSWQKVAGLFIGFCGLLPIIFAYTPMEDVAGSFLRISFPEIALLGSIACSAYGWMVFKQCMQRGYSPVMINGISMFGGGIVAGITSLILEGAPKIKVPMVLSTLDSTIAQVVGLYSASWLMFMLYVFVLILIANIICYNLYGYLLARYSATFLSFAGFSTPLFAAFYDWMLIGDTITWHFAVSLGITFFGLYLFYRQELKIRLRQ